MLVKSPFKPPASQGEGSCGCDGEDGSAGGPAGRAGDGLRGSHYDALRYPGGTTLCGECRGTTRERGRGGRRQRESRGSSCNPSGEGPPGTRGCIYAICTDGIPCGSLHACYTCVCRPLFSSAGRTFYGTAGQDTSRQQQEAEHARHRERGDSAPCVTSKGESAAATQQQEQRGSLSSQGDSNNKNNKNPDCRHAHIHIHSCRSGSRCRQWRRRQQRQGRKHHCRRWGQSCRQGSGCRRRWRH